MIRPIMSAAVLAVGCLTALVLGGSAWAQQSNGSQTGSGSFSL